MDCPDALPRRRLPRAESMPVTCPEGRGIGGVAPGGAGPLILGRRGAGCPRHTRSPGGTRAAAGRVPEGPRQDPARQAGRTSVPSRHRLSIRGSHAPPADRPRVVRVCGRRRDATARRRVRESRAPLVRGDGRIGRVRRRRLLGRRDGWCRALRGEPLPCRPRSVGGGPRSCFASHADAVEPRRGKDAPRSPERSFHIQPAADRSPGAGLRRNPPPRRSAFGTDAHLGGLLLRDVGGRHPISLATRSVAVRLP